MIIEINIAQPFWFVNIYFDIYQNKFYHIATDLRSNSILIIFEVATGAKVRYNG